MLGSVTDQSHTQSRVELFVRFVQWADSLPASRLTLEHTVSVWEISYSTAMRWLRAYHRSMDAPA